MILCQQAHKCCSKRIAYYVCHVFSLTVLIGSGLLFVWSIKRSAYTFHSLFQGIGFSNTTNPEDQYSIQNQGFPQVNETAKLLMQVNEHGTKECHNKETTDANFISLPRPINGSRITLSIDQVHEFYIISYENGRRRCNGGDFYETDLSGPNWKSRPPTEDLGDGAYAVKLFVNSKFEGLYKFTAVLLFSNFHGLERSPENWVQRKTLIMLEIEFKSDIKEAKNKTSLHLCRPRDFKQKDWAGRWNRKGGNETCSFDNRGRSICIPLEEKCDDMWCQGVVGLLESNGWVYSAHCKFHIWTKDEAWQCLNHKWLFFWGDSNNEDTIRNLLNFIFEGNYSHLSRTFEVNITDGPHNTNSSLRSFRITSIFNGHIDVGSDDWGLETIMHHQHQEELKKYFSSEKSPDIVVLNSGLHDGLHWQGLQPFIHPAEFASKIWHDIWLKTTKKPIMIYRSTVAPAGESRQMPSNPQKMEAYNRVLSEQLLKRFPDLRMVDAYDMTFPWHYDHCCSDGGHYGRPPSLDLWHGRHGHMYFVDLMLVHVLLNAICPLPST